MIKEQSSDPNQPQTSRLNHLAQEIARSADLVKYVGYKQAEKDCECLAERLVEHYSRDDLRSFHYTAIPRGGFIILGMLAYMLDLGTKQLKADKDPARPQVIVDDCALTGSRFRQQLTDTPGDHILFAHLYSHPELRKAIIERESRVKSSIAAHDLVDHAQEYFLSLKEYQAWKNRWSQRYGQARYWIGMPDLVCFAWSEPDQPFFNPVRDRIEDGWRFVPPHLCLKNRIRHDLPPKAVVTRQYQAPTSLVSGVFDEELWLVNSSSQKVFQLSGTAADIWRGLAVYGSEEATIDYIMAEYDVDQTQLRADVQAFASSLLANGLLERSGDE